MKNKIIILGAGSSKDFGLPLANEIFLEAHTVLSEKKKSGVDCERLEEAINRTEEIMHVLYSNLTENKKEYPPFEEVITSIEMLNSDKFNSKPFDLRGNKDEIFDCFVAMMGLTFAARQGRPLVLDILYMNKFENYRKYIKLVLSSNDNIVFISLNYDMLIDIILEDLEVEYNYGVKLFNLENGNLYNGTSVFLFKPHGSLNLAYCPQCFNFLYFRDNIFSPITNNTEWATCPFCIAQEKILVKPLIIPPLYNKKEFINKMSGVVTSGEKQIITNNGECIVTNSIFKKYRDTLDVKIIDSLINAEEIIVIGYSMPAYDYDFKHLLLEGLILNKERRNVPIKIITETNGIENERDRLYKKYCYLAGQVVFESTSGFYNYILKNVLRLHR